MKQPLKKKTQLIFFSQHITGSMERPMEHVEEWIEIPGRKTNKSLRLYHILSPKKNLRIKEFGINSFLTHGARILKDLNVASDLLVDVNYVFDPATFSKLWLQF